MFNGWLTERQLTLESPCVGGKEIELHQLFLIVGAFGGYRAVSEKKTWPVVATKIGLSPLNGLLPHCKPEVAEQLSEIYLRILGDFEVHWHNSLRPGDPTSIFPLPPQLQYLRPEIERLATGQFPLQPQQPQQPQQPERPLGAEPPRQPDINARRPIPNQMGPQTPQMGQTQAATQQQEAIVRNQPGVALPSQPGPSGSGGPIAVPSPANLPPPLQWLFANSDILKLGPEELKMRGLSDEVIEKALMYRQHLISKTIQVEKEQEVVLQQRQLQAQQQTWALGGVLGATGLQSSALPQPGGPLLPATFQIGPGLNIPPDQFLKAQEKVRAALPFLATNTDPFPGDHSFINLSREEQILLEESIQHTESLLKRVAQNLVSFVALAPNDEHELNRMAQMVVRVSDQALILRKPSPEKRFILGLGDLNKYRDHFTAFLMCVKDLHDQAHNQQSSGARPSVPRRAAQQEPPAPQLQPATQVPMHPPTAEVPQPPISAQQPVGAIAQPYLLPQTSVAVPPKPGLPTQVPIKPPVWKPMPPTAVPTVSLTSPAGPTPINHVPTPVPAESRNAQKPQIPVKPAPSKPTLKISHTEVSGTSRLQAERPPSKRGREDDVNSPDGSAGPSGLHKRARTDPQDPGSKRNADITAAKQFMIAATPAATEKGETKPSGAVTPIIKSMIQILDHGYLYGFSADLSANIPGLAAAVPFKDASAPGVKPEEKDVDDWWWAIDSSQWAAEDLAAD
ncbi:hypothetical protein FRC00_002399 [Tulasnella sp. 408]|nr:hypothetical protein FRC00_002399 [Tulasnella sp. 408]